MSRTNEPKLKKHGVQILQGRLIGTELQRDEARIQEPPATAKTGWKLIKTLTVEETADLRARMGLDDEGLRRSREEAPAAKADPSQVAYNDGYATFDRGDSRDPVAAGCPHQHRRSWLNGYDDARDEDAEGLGHDLEDEDLA